MDVYILKFSACLALFVLFYKLFLENQNMHRFKRFYLLASLVFAFSVPFITFTEYVEPVQPKESFQTSFEPVFVPQIVEEPQVNYLPMILWSIYGLGVLLFSIKFILNLIRIFSKIRKNETHKSQSFIYVLLNDLAIPHSFFSYIFLNKEIYKTEQIPNEVLIHEQTHAKQKHSIDVLLIELLQIVFWFHPLVYIIKHAVKLNHEFLADDAVLKEGVEASTYQQLLIAFSSNASKHELASAINYSSIKKRFTVMKTHTSKQTIWLRSLLLLPIIALTLYGFSARKEVEKQPTKKEKILLQNSYEIPILEITFNPDVFKLNGKETSLLKLKEDFVKAAKNEKSDLDIRVIGGINMSLINQIMGELKGHLIKINLNEEAFIIGDDMTNKTQQKATTEEVSEYNKLASQHNDKPEKLRIIKQKDFERMEYLHKKMSKEQKADAEAFPNFPPPPSPATSFIEVNGETLFVIHYSPKRYYNKKGYLVDKNGKTLNGNTQVNAADVLPGHYITKVYQNGVVVVEFRDNIPNQKKTKVIKGGEWSDVEQHLKQDKKVINEIHIHIDKNEQLFLNNNSVTINVLAEKVNALNSHLSTDEKRKYSSANITFEGNSKLDLAKEITNILVKKCNLYSSSIMSIDSHNKLKSKSDILNPYVGKSVEEAKKKYENETFDFSIKEQPKNSPWSISTEANEVTFVELDEEPIEAKITEEELKEYNVIVKKFNALPNDKRIIKKRDFERMGYIYSHLSEEQKKKAEPYPNFYKE